MPVTRRRRFSPTSPSAAGLCTRRRCWRRSVRAWPGPRATARGPVEAQSLPARVRLARRRQRSASRPGLSCSSWAGRTS
eukprot:6253940-Alexandrium_andersonii.AAC.1